MRRLGVILLVLALGLGMLACGKKAETKEPAKLRLISEKDVKDFKDKDKFLQSFEEYVQGLEAQIDSTSAPVQASLEKYQALLRQADLWDQTALVNNIIHLETAPALLDKYSALKLREAKTLARYEKAAYGEGIASYLSQYTGVVDSLDLWVNKASKNAKDIKEANVAYLNKVKEANLPGNETRKEALLKEAEGLKAKADALGKQGISLKQYFPLRDLAKLWEERANNLGIMKFGTKEQVDQYRETVAKATQSLNTIEQLAWSEE